MAKACVLIGGGTGLVGSRLSELFAERQYEVIHISRKAKPDAKFKTYQWDLKNRTIDPEAIEKADYVINLAGAGIADARWTDKRKKLIINSRVDSTLTLKTAFEKAGKAPKAFVSAAAMGYYGDSGETLVTEDSPPGNDGFLSASCVAWEEALDKVKATGWRTARIRIGIVLSTQGGALEKMLIPAKMKIGGYFGDGQQWYSWIHIEDLCRLFIFLTENEQLNGTFNGVSPNPERNKPFTRKIGEAIGRPPIMAPGPEFVMRIAMGEMADTIFSSTKVSAEKTLGTGFEFKFPELIGAVKDVVDRGI